jgi:hypothetical protein
VHPPAARHPDRAFVRGAVNPQNPQAVVLVADTGAFSSVTTGIRHVRLSELRRSIASFVQRQTRNRVASFNRLATRLHEAEIRLSFWCVHTVHRPRRRARN